MEKLDAGKFEGLIKFYESNRDKFISLQKNNDLYVPPRHRGYLLGDFPKPIQALVLESLMSLESEKPQGLFLSGDVGSAKTAILRMMQTYLHAKLEMQEIARDSPEYHPAQHRFIKFEQLIGWLRKDKSNEEQTSGPYETYLFIDDLARGYQDEKGWNLSLLDEFFDSRWEWEKIMFVSTNLSLENIRETPDWARIMDRLLDPQWMISCSTGAESRRR